MKQNTVQHFVFILSIFLLIVSPALFREGMFSDGLQYAAVSNNLANNRGTFWDLYLSRHLYPHFHEHPPLVFFLQSLWFKLFGNSVYVERFYSLTVFLLTSTFIVLIWKEITKKIDNGWIPLLLLISIPKVSWACANNMLENTMMVFTTLSVLFYLKSLKKSRIAFLILSGLSLTAALLSKGFTALYVWSLPFWLFVFTKKTSLRRMITDFLLLILFTLLPIILLITLSADAKESLSAYFNRQILGSFKYGQTVNNRIDILLDFMSGIIIPSLLALITYAVATGKRIQIEKNGFKSSAMVFFALSLSGVLPIMISLKQRSFYILTVYPFFAISLALILLPYITGLFSGLKNRRDFQKRFSQFVYPFFILSILFSYLQTFLPGRDSDIISDVNKIIEYTGKDKDISIKRKLYEDWTLHGYFARYGNVSLDPNENMPHKFLISKTEIKDSSILRKYFKSGLKTKKIILYQKKE